MVLTEFINDFSVDSSTTKQIQQKPKTGIKTNVIIQAKTLTIDRGLRKTVINAATVLTNSNAKKDGRNHTHIQFYHIFLLQQISMIKRDRHLIRADFMRNLLINFILQFTICVISLLWDHQIKSKLFFVNPKVVHP